MPDRAQLALSSKRRKIASNEAVTAAPPSKVPQIFAPFRAIGIVANHVPPALQVRGKAYHVTTCVGKSFQTYDVRAFVECSNVSALN
jgi:U3 small nucleolar RNA-associated protein 21